jgi:predicted MFS family arabinose efflux permease
MDSRLIWLALAAFVGSTEGGLIAGLLPSISEDMNVTPGQAGQVVLGYSLSYAIGTPILAVLLGSIGRRRILAGAQLTLAVCAILIAVSPFFAWLVGARTLLAVAAGLFTGTALAVAAMIAPQGQRGRALQIVSMGQSLAVLVGVPIGAWVATTYSWRIDYIAIAMMAAIAAAALFLKLPTGMHGDAQTMADRARVIRNPGVVPALVTTMLFMVAAYPPLVYIGAVMDEAALDKSGLPLMLFANGVGAVVAGLSAGRLADRIGNRQVVAGTGILLVICLAALVALPHLPPVTRGATLFVSMAVIGYCGWAYWIAHCSQMAHLAPSSVPVAISLNLTALNIGVAIAAAVGGIVLDRFGANMLSIVAIPVGVAGVVLWLMIPDRPAAAASA